MRWCALRRARNAEVVLADVGPGATPPPYDLLMAAALETASAMTVCGCAS